MRKIRQTFPKSTSFWILFLVAFFWLSTRSKPQLINLEDKTLPWNVSVASELASLPNRLGCLWTSTRDNILRKSTWPLKSNYRYGLQFNTKNNTLHLFLCILLAGDIATNPILPAKLQTFLYSVPQLMPEV